MVVAFLDEQKLLPHLLASIEAQSELPDQLLLVDDGSGDDSWLIAQAFAERHRWSATLRLPRRERARDRLAEAAELKAFQSGVERLEPDWDIVAKIDADLRLNPGVFSAVRARFSSDSELGIAGTRLSVEGPYGGTRREGGWDDRVMGPNKFYRRECFEEISPLPAILGWDTIDDLRARRAGWRIETFALDDGESIHLRPMGSHDGRLRAYRRWGAAAWGYGAHPLWVMLGGVFRMSRAPFVLGGFNYIFGWLSAALRAGPRAEREVRAQARAEDMAELQRRIRHPPWR